MRKEYVKIDDYMFIMKQADRKKKRSIYFSIGDIWYTNGYEMQVENVILGILQSYIKTYSSK